MSTLQVGWRIPHLSRGIGWRFSTGAAAFLVSFLLREALSPWLHDRDYVVFVPAIILTTFFAGVGPAILATLLSGAAVWYFFTSPSNSFRLDVDGAVGLATFLVSSVVAIFLVHWLRITIARAEAEQARAEESEARTEADLRDMVRLNQLSSRLVQQSSDSDKCLNEVVDTAIALSRADKANVQLLDLDSGALTIAAQRGFESPFLTFFAQVRDAASACAAALQANQRVIVEDVTSSEIFARQPSQKVLIDAGVRAVISTPLTSGTGNILGMISTHFSEPHRPSEQELQLLELLARQTADYLERKRAEEVEKTLIREVQHRSINLLTVVQAVANLSLSGDGSLAKAKKAFEERLQALARANRQLRRSNWSGVHVSDLVRLELKPFADRTIVEGTDVMLTHQHAQSFSLALHELATNAAKYGAFSNGSGKVAIFWSATNEDGHKKLKFKWREDGGPPLAAPTHHGFGTSLLKTVFPNVRIDYAKQGLRCEIDLPLA
jgi:two-component sensor histidine kinase